MSNGPRRYEPFARLQLHRVWVAVLMGPLKPEWNLSSTISVSISIERNGLKWLDSISEAEGVKFWEKQ